MKEFIKNKKITYNLMSFTAFKALIFFSELVEGPKSFSEIKSIFYNHPYLREQISIDTFRVYINSLKRLGCEVKRVKNKGEKESKYMVATHPFELKYSDEQLKSALNIFKSLVKNIDIEDLISLEDLFEKIGSHINNEKFINDAKKVSFIRETDKNLLKELIECCKNKNQIIITYNSPNSGDKDIELITDKIDIKNNKIYLYGFGFEYKQYNSFPISRIKKIVEIKSEKNIPENLEKTKVVYEIKNITPELESYEKIIDFTNNTYTIEAVTSNLFLLRQRLLNFGPSCTILSPSTFRNEFINLLKDMKAGYYHV